MIYEQEIQEIKNELAQVSKMSAELTSAKYQKRISFRNIVVFILSILLVISVCINLYFLLAYEKVTETTETITTTNTFEGIEQNADNGGSNNVIGGDYYGNAEN